MEQKMDDAERPGRLYEAIRQQPASKPVFLLSEVKTQSPRDGDLLRGRDPAELVRQMVAGGADGISVVIEGEHFGGDVELLETVAASVDVPILAKDFFETPEEIDRAVDHGADAVLLISNQLSESKLEALYEHCLIADVTPLVETHTLAEIRTANELSAPLVGINNRDIGQLELDDGGVERTKRLASRVHDEAFIVSESSLSSPEEISEAVDAGVDAVLVGTAILQANSAGAKVEQLRSI
jgi:indole-3-glycerol phosphate synthase